MDKAKPSGCPLPYGEKQGSFRGVVASSNRDDGFFSGESNYVDYVVYTGFRYQCVEFARRFLLLTTGCIFGSCGRASEIFKMTTITHVETGVTYNFNAHPNGKSERRPAPGDIIVYPYHRQHMPWGHVGVISYVGDDGKVGIAEQNHVFFPFFSPSPDYLDGECCVSRYIHLEQTSDGYWYLKEQEGESGVDCLGWMSYPGVPQRKLIHKQICPIPEQLSVRSTPVENMDHPSLWQFTLPDDSCAIRTLYIFRQGTGEALIGATTAFSRIIRVTLQFLFNRHRLSAGFNALPTNPLGADLMEAPKTLLDVMEASILEGCEGEAEMDRALAAHFGFDITVIAAMRREFNLGEVHMLANTTFCLNLAEESTMKLDSGFEVNVMKIGNPHDEGWLIEKVNFGTPKIISELAGPRACRETYNKFLHQALSPEVSGSMMSECRVDFSRYVKDVEGVRGPRNGFTIVKNSHHSNDTVDNIISIIIEYCEAFKYPTLIVDESQLLYESKHSKLYASLEAGKKLQIDFCFCITEWSDIIAASHSGTKTEGKYEGLSALRQAALDPHSDVVFAKPLWSLLCSGKIRPTAKSLNSTSSKFFDISRRLYEYASPKQPPDMWERDVHEFKDSCRRCHLSLPLSEGVTSRSARGETVLVNFAVSCCTGRDPDGNIAGLMYAFY
ncbi:putative trypanothione synthetase [Trypanosoma theileri]|uniref:Putative trypanothione synthetase n=1 Tax=Trypanosoma theileri TaxID=67003 RepID=A0A1X0P094_9TRYP|nr:putative trypanothione synthetase [Trypanosoma theileri]ORC90364.1 putative trypanothione synthetase [Trypanosoma theileri]